MDVLLAIPDVRPGREESQEAYQRRTHAGAVGDVGFLTRSRYRGPGLELQPLSMTLALCGTPVYKRVAV
jgi:hypothetical protein